MQHSVRLVMAALAFFSTLATASNATAFKPEMHIRTTNVAIVDAFDGGICLPGLTEEDGTTGKPEQIWLGNTELAHLWASVDETGAVDTEFRTWLPQYAPMMRAGAVGPDGFPDPLIGQLFTHENHAVPRPPAPVSLPFNSEAFNSLFEHGPSGQFDRLGETLEGKPKWRSIDWGHEVLYRALTFRQDEIDAARANGNRLLEQQLREARRPAIAFALGYLMHMIGDGQAHAMINEVVGKPWGYTDTTRYEDGFYLWMAPLREELQHMAIERYINSAFFPGSEPKVDRALIDGDACSPLIASSEIKLMCVPTENYIEPPLPCEYCNPLRSGDPSELSNRCDHCFSDCNPWRELCTPTVPEGAGNRCDNVCDDLQTTECDALADGPDKRDCLSKACTDARMNCICQDSIGVLTDLGVLPENDANVQQYTCEGAFFGPRSGRADRVRTQLVDAFKNGPLYESAERRDLIDEAAAGLESGDCDTAPMEMSALFDAAVLPEDRIPPTLSVPLEGQPYDIETTGPEIDLNQNGAPDLLNECVYLNCKLNPHECPWLALDRDEDERTRVDIRTCFDPDLGAGAKIHGEVAGICDAEEPSPLAIKVDPQRLFSANAIVREEAREQFMNSSYIEVPQNFIAEAFYMDRRYSEDAIGAGSLQAGRPGTYSLGGYPVNAVHVILDALDMIEMWVYVAITRPVDLIRYLAPNSEVARTISQFIPTLQRWIDMLIAIGDELANSPVLNFSIDVWVPNFSGDFFSEPYVKKTIAIEIGKKLAKVFYAQAAILQPLQIAFNEVMETVAGAVTSLFSIRHDNLEEHLRTGWTEATTCSAGTVANGAHRSYSIDKFKEFAEDAVEILVTGRASCPRPALVDAILNGDFDSVDFSSIAGQIQELFAWFQCKIFDLLFEVVVKDALQEPLEAMLKKASEKLFCDTLISANQQHITAEAAEELELSCADIHTVLWQPEYRLAEPIIREAMEALEAVDIDIEQPSGNTESVNLLDFVRNMRMVTVGTCWDGSLDTTELTPRNQLLASFGDSELEQEVTDDNGNTSLQRVCEIDWPWVESGSVSPVPPEAEFVDTLDTWMNLQPRDVRVANAAGDDLDIVRRDIMTTSSFAPAYNAIQLSKLALLGPGDRGNSLCWFDEEECDQQRSSCVDCSPPDDTDLPPSGGVRQIIDSANALAADEFGSGDLGWRPLEDHFYAEPDGTVVGQLTANTPDELDAFFSASFTTGSRGDDTSPGLRRCEDLNWNLMCDAIYSLDDPDDHCRHAAAWAVSEGIITAAGGSQNDACVWRQVYENPCDLLDGVYDAFPGASRYLPDPTRGANLMDPPWACNVRYYENNLRGVAPHNGMPWNIDEHWEEATPHQRSFWVDAARRSFPDSTSDTHSHGYNLTRFSMANKDTHVARIYANVFSPFYCPDAGSDQIDEDCDGVPDACDNCPAHYNPTQQRSGYGSNGDACQDGTEPEDRRCVDPNDLDGDGIPDDAGTNGGTTGGDGDDEGCKCAIAPGGGGGWDASLLLLGLTLLMLPLRRRRRLPRD